MEEFASPVEAAGAERNDDRQLVSRAAALVCQCAQEVGDFVQKAGPQRGYVYGQLVVASEHQGRVSVDALVRAAAHMDIDDFGECDLEVGALFTTTAGQNQLAVLQLERARNRGATPFAEHNGVPLVLHPHTVLGNVAVHISGIP